jgi:signal transduction histidine kinase
VKFTDEGYIELRVFPTTKGGSTRSNNASPRLRSPFHQPLADGGLYDGTHSPVLRFEVRDTGRGISPEATESLFQPFWQVRGEMCSTWFDMANGIS